MQLILGRKFKLPVWEALIQKMALSEVSKFVVDKSVSFVYTIHIEYSFFKIFHKYDTRTIVFRTIVHES